MKSIAGGLALLFLLAGSLFLNIYIHEYGHYFVAERYDLNPEVHFEAIKFEGGTRLNLYAPAAYTSYDSYGTVLSAQDAAIAFAGPLVNLIFALLVCTGYILVPKHKRTFWVQACFIMLAVPAFASFLINIIPVGYSDGAVIFGALFQ